MYDRQVLWGKAKRVKRTSCGLSSLHASPSSPLPEWVRLSGLYSAVDVVCFVSNKMEPFLPYRYFIFL